MQYKIVVLRYGHRPARDKRVTTHCALVARAFGAHKIIITDVKDENVENSVKKVVELWGGPFEIVSGIPWRKVIKEWKGEIIHLTMYGLPLNKVIGEIRSSTKDKLILVGAEKVPKDFYEIANYNVAITNQPHSEVAALAVFLHELFRGKELEKKFKNAKMKVIPCERGKKVVKLDK